MGPTQLPLTLAAHFCQDMALERTLALEARRGPLEALGCARVGFHFWHDFSPQTLNLAALMSGTAQANGACSADKVQAATRMCGYSTPVQWQLTFTLSIGLSIGLFFWIFYRILLRTFFQVLFQFFFWLFRPACFYGGFGLLF